MARGGARPGAGRKQGSATIKTRQIADEAAETGLTPLAYMLSVVRDETATKADRMDMAKAAARYVHPALSTIEARVEGDIAMLPSVVEFVAPDAGED